jgi:hypothetical protein
MFVMMPHQGLLLVFSFIPLHMSRHLFANRSIGELSSRCVVDGVGDGLLDLLGETLCDYVLAR